MTSEYSSDSYWADDYWFNVFMWWVLGLTVISAARYVVRFEDRTLGIEQDNRKFVVPMEDRTDDIE